jgi:phenylpropionate dioxygenase-like ring-hydroxylating dioxygenase large terminal subunit
VNVVAKSALDAWRPLLPARELRDAPREVHLLGHEIVLYRTADGRAHALNNRCPHRRMRLALGKVVGDRLVCPYHGWNFGPDGAGASPANPGLRVQTRCYDVSEHHGMLWLREAGGSGDLPELRHDDFHPVARLHHTLDAPLGLLIDNMCELEHTASVHSVFGFETERLHEVRTETRGVEDGFDIDYEGPQRQLPWYLRWVTGIRRGDRFVQRAAVRRTPMHATYDLEWFASGSTPQRRPLALKFVIFFNETGPDSGTQTTFVFAQASAPLTRLAIRYFGFVLRHHIDAELRADIALVESLRLSPEMAPHGVCGRFDKPLVMRRQAEARAQKQAAAVPLRSVPS